MSRANKALPVKDRETVEKWKPTGLLDQILRHPHRALLAAKELDEHAQYALDHMSEHENWINTSVPLAERKKEDWANWYFNERVKEMRLRGCFDEVGNNE